MKYTADQLKTIHAITRIGRDRGVPRKYIVSALATGAVESNFRNLSGGDADSAGWRQERASLYKNPTNLKASINRYFDEAAQLDHGQNAAELSADVQRPAAQYRGRYAEHLGEARKLVSRGAGAASLGTPGTMTGGTAPRLNPGGTATDSKGAMLAALLNHNGGSLMGRFRHELSTGNYTTTTPATVTPGKSPRYVEGTDPSVAGGVGGGRLARIKAEADRIDAATVPYLWGGGHQAKQKRGSKVTPLDCSGAVSRLLGIDPRVASQFKSWGRAGEGKDFTIYARDDHVLVKIGGHFWGTSGSNPGGGAGWIPASAVSKSYLSRFTARTF